MNNETKKGKLVPELRFPGFEGEWPIQPLSNFLHEHKTKSDGKCRVHSVSVSKGVVDQVEYLGRSFAASDTSKYNLAKPNDIIYTKSPTGSFPYGIVKMNKNPYNVIVSPLYGVYSPTNKYVGYILDSYFESPERTNTYLSTLIQKGAKNTIQITNSTFISKNVCFPTDEAEQQKIAECLSSVDDCIKAETDQLQALKDHKKGLMQQLFPQEGETTPKLRFPGFEGEWEEKKLGEIAEVNPKSDSLPEQFIYIDLESVESGVLLKLNQIDKINAPSRAQRLLKNGDILFQMVRPYQKNNYHFFKKDNKEYVASTGYAQIRYSDCSEYLYQFLHTDTFVEKVINKCVGGNYPAINSTDLSNMTVFFPSLPEQQKIASCLSSLDEGIAAQQEKVEALREHKKGLMQKLFPRIN